jgi:putative endonuclease
MLPKMLTPSRIGRLMLPTTNHWLVYMIRTSDRQVYTGITTDIGRRWKQHASGTGAKYFRSRRPMTLALLEQQENRSVASQKEYALKQLTRAQKEDVIRAQQQTTLLLRNQLCPEIETDNASTASLTHS